MYVCDINADGIAAVESEEHNWSLITSIVLLMVTKVFWSMLRQTLLLMANWFPVSTSLRKHAALFDTAVETFGDVDGIINNAGIIRDGLLAKVDRKTGEVKTLSNRK